MSDGRQRLTPKERAALHEQQNGRCVSCYRTEDEAGPFIEEHTVPNYFRSGKPDALMCERCHGEKTPQDQKDIAKCKRRKAKHEGTYRPSRRPIPKPENYNWPRRPFPKREKRA